MVFFKRFSFIVLTVLLGIMFLPRITYAEEANQIYGFDQAIWQNAELNVMSQERQEKQEAWQKFTLEEQYNYKYGEYFDKLLEYYKKFEAMKKMAEEGLGYEAYTFKDEIHEVGYKVEDLQPEPKYAYSRKYLSDCYDNLGEAVNYLDRYSVCYGTNLFDEADRSMEKINEYLKKYQENFKIAYQYYVMTLNGIGITEETNQTESRFTEELEKCIDNYSKVYDKLYDAYKETKKRNKKGFHILKDVKNNYILKYYVTSPEFQTENHKDLARLLDDIGDIACDLHKKIDFYFSDVITGGKGDDSEIKSLLKEFKEKYDKLKDGFSEINSKNKEIENNVSNRVLEVQRAELNEAKSHGYNTVEEYKLAQREQKEVERTRRIMEEAQRLVDEKIEMEERYKKMQEEIHQRWLDERIDFHKSKSQQKHDKKFYMGKVKENLDFNSFPNLSSIIYNVQSEAYDVMWNLARSKNANLNLLQKLYDEYPNDFTTIVNLYNVEKSF